MDQSKQKTQGNKTHEAFQQTVERKSGLHRPEGADGQSVAASTHTTEDGAVRTSEFAVSRGGMNQESRDHNKHNDGGQSGHKPQKHSSAEEKH